MKQLKAYVALINELDPTPCQEVYLKSDADKVIADKDREIGEQKRLRDMALASVPNVLKVMKIIQHQKYKRCVAMAELCQARYDEEDAKVNGRGASWDYTSQEMKYWERWSNRWLILSDKFKEDL